MNDPLASKHHHEVEYLLFYGLAAFATTTEIQYASIS